MLYQQPRGAGRLDTNNPLTKGALAVVSGTSNVNLVSGKLLVGSQITYPSATFVGQAFQFRNNYYIETELLPAIGTAAYVEFWVGSLTSFVGAKGNRGAEKFLTGSSANNIGIYQNTESNAAWGAVDSWSGNIKDTSSDVLPADNGKVVTLVAVRHANGTRDLWRDGIKVGTFVHSAQNIAASTMILGSFIEDVSYWSSESDTVLAGRIQNDWSDSDAKSFCANPWQIIADPGEEEETLLFRSVAGGAPYALTAATSAFAVTGNAASLRASRTMAASAASFALSGSPASLRASRRIAAAPAAFAVSAVAANLRAARSMAAATGSFSVTGSAAALRLARQMAIAPGSYLLTATSARLAAQHRLPAAAGAFSITGNAVSLVYGQIHPAGASLALLPGAFVITGNAASLRAARRLTAAQASYALTGNAAALVRGRRLVAANGAIVITGGTAVFQVAHRLAANTGAFALIGIDVNLVYSAFVRYARAPAGAGYAPQSEQQQRRPTDCAQSRPADKQRNHR